MWSRALAPAFGRALSLPARRPAACRSLGVRVASSIVDTVSGQMKEAMKAKDNAKLAALRNMRAAFLTAMKADGSESLSDDKAVETLRKLAKQRAESIASFKAVGRDEAVAAEQAELRLIETFLPALADEAQTEAWVKEAIAAVGATKAADVGKVVGAVNKARKGLVDNALVSAVAKRLLGGA